MLESKPIQTDRSQANPITSAIRPEQHREGPIALSIEKQTAKVPSDVFLFAAGVAALGSFVLEMAGCKDKSRFIGQWVAPILICGVYNKIVKTHGSDKLHSEEGGSGGSGGAGVTGSSGNSSRPGSTHRSPGQTGPDSAEWQR